MAMMNLNETQVDAVCGGWTLTDAFTNTGSSYWLTGDSDMVKEYEEAQRKQALREEAAEIAAETGEDPLVVYADLMGY